MHYHFLVYKPYRMLSQFMTNDRHQQNKRMLGELHDFPKGLMAVGRLDLMSEGLLLLTTNGSLSYHITSTGLIDKEYLAQVDGIITDQAIQELADGVTISSNGSKYTTQPCQAQVLEYEPDLPVTNQRIRDDRHGPTSWIRITLRQGKFRQVRKMTSVVGHPTLRLARIRIGPLGINDLIKQTVMQISDNDINDLFFNND